MILFGGADVNSVVARAEFPVTFEDSSFTVGSDTYGLAGEGIAFTALNPFSTQSSHAQPRIAVVLAGTDASGFQRAAAQLPRRSGITAPDWVVVGGSLYSWAGVGGWLASGYWDNDWEFVPEASTGASSVAKTEEKDSNYSTLGMFLSVLFFNY